MVTYNAEIVAAFERTARVLAEREQRKAAAQRAFINANAAAAAALFQEMKEEYFGFAPSREVFHRRLKQRLAA